MMTEEEMKKEPGKIFVLVTALMYAGLGVLFIIHPAGMSSGLGYESLNLAALTDVMATYGGLELAVGVLLFETVRSSNVAFGLRIVLITFAGFALGRFIGAIRFGGFEGLHGWWFVFEIVYIAIALHFIAKSKKSKN